MADKTVVAGQKQWATFVVHKQSVVKASAAGEAERIACSGVNQTRLAPIAVQLGQPVGTSLE